MINLIPQLIKDRGLTLSEFHKIMEGNPNTQLSYRSLLKLANKDQYFLPSATKIETMDKIATALGLRVDDLYTKNGAS